MRCAAGIPLASVHSTGGCHEWRLGKVRLGMGALVGDAVGVVKGGHCVGGGTADGGAEGVAGGGVGGWVLPVGGRALLDYLLAGVWGGVGWAGREVVGGF